MAQIDAEKDISNSAKICAISGRKIRTSFPRIRQMDAEKDQRKLAKLTREKK